VGERRREEIGITLDAELNNNMVLMSVGFNTKGTEKCGEEDPKPTQPTKHHGVAC
jgi:hypothetical protein